MRESKLNVLYEDNHLLVLSKPAGIATMGISDQSASLLGQAKAYIREKYNKPGNVYLGVVSRLDSLVSGVIIFARTSKAAARLNEQFKAGTVGKVYQAAVEGRVSQRSGTLTDWLVKNESQHKMQVASQDDRRAKKAVLNFEVLKSEKKFSILEIRLETGRKHQIRVQLSSIGHPVIGDRKYGSVQPFAKGIALHSLATTIIHPTTKEKLTFDAALPKSWKRFET